METFWKKWKNLQKSFYQIN